LASETLAPLPVTASMSPAMGAIAAHARLPATDVASAAASDDMKKSRRFMMGPLRTVFL